MRGVKEKVVQNGEITYAECTHVFLYFVAGTLKVPVLNHTGTDR